MQIESLHCPCNGREDNPLDHYRSGVCTMFPGLLGWIEGILADMVNDEIHRDLTITTTRLTGSCAREVAILDTTPVVGFDWRLANSLAWGSMLHAKLHASAPPGYYAEVLVPPKDKEAALILGLPLRGKLDCVTSDMSMVIDYKGHSESQQRKKSNKPPDPEVIAQLTIYGMMLMRNFGVPQPRLVIDHGAMVAAGGEPWLIQEVAPMEEEEILGMFPFGGAFSVRDRIKEYQEFVANRESGVPLDTALKNMSLMGRSIWRGDKCMKYCFAKRKCDELEGIVSI